MSSFEKEYYESDKFWEGEMLQDPVNKERIFVSASLIPPGTRTLADIGCGNGVFINYLLDNHNNLELTGVDRSATALKSVRSNKVEADIANLPFADQHFDCVTCLEVIEHLPIPVYTKALRELTRIAKDHVIISVPFQEKLESSYTRCPSCRTVFNKELHLRSFDEKKVSNLLNEFGFKCVSTRKLNPISSFVGHDLYRRLFYPEQFEDWDSPICPICGFEQNSNGMAQHNARPVENASPGRKWISYLSALPKLFWPKKTRFYWIIARYGRIGPG